ncbi:hypothetical protein FQN54_006630 [Arachnomyces sp. PD_36]|nr:hypothetical protein FQN54_006630 [Arachnomyces sp. PD_36]
MKKTLLLVFIHGFKGGDDTFGNFPEHLRALVSHALPKIDVVSVTYPQFETRGKLEECVGRFREWLQNKVIDIEVANETPSPTVDPSVHVILIGHSMGGIVGAETLLLLASEQPLPPPSSQGAKSSHPDSNANKDDQLPSPNSFMFPHIQGLLAFDTPFLGIAPGVVSHGAEGHYKTAATAYGTVSEIAGVFGWGANKKESGNDSKGSSSTNSNKQPLSLPAASSENTPTSNTDAAATPSWQRWGRYAMFAGAAGAVAAGGAAALYSQRERFSAGWNWATSHMEFVGCLARPEELRQRVAALSKLHEERGIGCADFYTCLGKGARDTNSGSESNYKTYAGTLGQSILRSKYRTFCNLPSDVVVDKSRSGNEEDGKTAETASAGLKWVKALNEKAPEETSAHMGMFSPTDNAAFYELLHEASDMLGKWVDMGWYSSATPRQKQEQKTGTDASDDPLMDEDDIVVVD